MKQYNTIIFDLDGTLLYTLEDLAASVNYALEQSGYPVRSLEEVRHFVGNGIYRLVELSVPATCTKEELDHTFSLFKSHYADNCNNKTRAYDGVLPLLQELTHRGYRLAIVSNKVDSAVKTLNEIYFKEFISVAIGATDGIAKKPAPDTVYKALEELESKRDEAIYVGDSEVDVKTASNAGMPCISVTWGFREKETLLEAGATTLIDTPEQLLDILKD